MKHKYSKLFLSSITIAILSIQLTGCVGLLVAGAAGGAAVAMDRRDVEANIDDKQIEFRVNSLLAKEFPYAHINSEVFNRNVLLTGEVFSNGEGQRVAASVRGIDKVRTVTNALAVGEPSGLLARSRDTAITAKVKAALIEDRLLHSSAFIVTTERGNVYLQGRVTHAEATRASELARDVSGVRQVVKVFDYLTEEQFRQLNSR